MSNTVIGLFLAIAGGGWVYFQVSKRLGGTNAKQALIIGIIAAIVLFALAVIILSKFFPS